MTTVVFGSAQPDQLVALALSAPACCALTNVDVRVASLRNDSGRPASAAQPIAAVTPGDDDGLDLRPACQIFELLAATAEDKRIAALQAYDGEPALRRTGEFLIDGVLADARMPAALADKHALGIAARPVENLGRDEFVVKDDIRASATPAMRGA